MKCHYQGHNTVPLDLVRLELWNHTLVTMGSYFSNVQGKRAVWSRYQAFTNVVKNGLQKNNFLISQPKHILWVLKEPSQWDSSFEHPNHMLKIMGKKIFIILPSKFLLSFCIASNHPLFLTRLSPDQWTIVEGRFSDVPCVINTFQARKFAQVYDKGPIETRFSHAR